MDRRRLDAALVAALAERGDDPSARFRVLVRLSALLSAEDLGSLDGLALPPDVTERTVFSVDATAEGIGRLSELPVVRSVRLSQELRPLDGVPRTGAS